MVWGGWLACASWQAELAGLIGQSGAWPPAQGLTDDSASALRAARSPSPQIFLLNNRLYEQEGAGPELGADRLHAAQLLRNAKASAAATG